MNATLSLKTLSAVRCIRLLCRPVNDLQTIVRNPKIKLEPKRLGIYLHIMKTKLFSLLRRIEKIDNTPATGHGDFPTVGYRVIMTVAASGEKQAKARFRKVFSNLQFSGKFAKHVCSSVN